MDLSTIYPNLSTTESSSALSSSETTEKSVNISTDDSPILLLPQELLSAIIDYVPKTQWPNLELVNRSFRDALYSSWQSMKEFDIGKDVLDIRQLVKGVRLSDILPSIFAKLLLRSSMLQSIIGFPEIDRHSEEILHIICQFTNLKQIDFGASGFKSLELVAFMTTSASRDRLMEIKSSSYNQTANWGNHNLPEIFIAGENSASQASRLKLEKLSLKSDFYLIQEDIFLDPGIIDLIDPSSLTVLVLDKVATPSDYLLSLITNCSQLQQLQFSFMKCCRCKKRPCVHFTSRMQVLEAIPKIENLDSLKIGMIKNGSSSDRVYLGIKADFTILIERLGWRGRLVEFGLLNANYWSDDIIVGIGQHLTGLKSLELVTLLRHSTTLVDMIKQMVNLEKLACCNHGRWDEGITTEVLTTVATHLRNLRRFHLWWSYNTDLHVLTSMEHLEELTIYGGSYHKINWESTTAFGHQLQSLVLRNCDVEFMAAFLKQVPGLRRLVLHGMDGYMPHKDKVLRLIPTACPGLRDLYLLPAVGYCGEDMKDGVQSIIDGCLEFENLLC